MAPHLQAQRQIRPHATRHDVRSMNGNTGNRTTSYSSVAYGEPIPSVNTSMHEQLNIPSAETRENSCPHCNGRFVAITWYYPSDRFFTPTFNSTTRSANYSI